MRSLSSNMDKLTMQSEEGGFDMTIELDHYCSRCGSVLQCRVEIVPTNRVFGETNFNVKVKPCDHCVTRFGDPVQIVEVEKQTKDRRDEQ